MTRGMKILRGGGVRKFLGTQRGGSEKISGGSENLYTSNPTGGGRGEGCGKRGELLKFQASSFNIFISPACHIK